MGFIPYYQSMQEKAKTQPVQHVKDKVPINPVICLVNTNLFKSLWGSYKIMKRKSTLNEAYLLFVDYPGNQ